MKKILAIMLACVMLAVCVPFSASAADVTGVETVNQAWTITSNETVVIKGTRTVTTTMTVYQGATVEIADGGSLIFTGESARLINSGTIRVKGGGTLTLSGDGVGTTETFVNNESGVLVLDNGSECTLAKRSSASNYGNIKNIGRMDVKGTLKHQVKIPGTFSESYSYIETWNRQNLSVDFFVSYYIPEAGDGDLDYTNTDSEKYVAVGTDGITIPVVHGQKLYICIEPDEESGSWVDVGRMQLVAGGQSVSSSTTELVNNDRGVFCVSPINAMDLEVYSTSYKDIVKIFEITLPRTDAYYVISKDGDVDEITVEYGKTFSFRVVLSPDYDKSDYYCYVNTLYMEPDEFGYYDVTGPVLAEGMATAGGVQEDISIQVMGVAANERQEMIGSLVGFIQEIFSVFKEIFSYFGDLFAGFGGLFGGSDATV